MLVPYQHIVFAAKPATIKQYIPVASYVHHLLLLPLPQQYLEDRDALHNPYIEA